MFISRIVFREVFSQAANGNFNEFLKSCVTSHCSTSRCFMQNIILGSSQTRWLWRSLLTSCILFSFGYVRWVDSCTTPFSRLSSSSVWEEEDPLRTVMSVCSDVALICAHFSRAFSTFLCMRRCTWMHVYIHTVLPSLNLLLYLYEVIASCFVHNIKRTSTPECRQWRRNRFWHHSALIRLRFCMRASSNCARLQ